MPSNMSSESFSLNNSKFLRYDAPDQKIFFISDELILLHKTKWYLDGTFFLLKNVSYSQVYIISIFFDFGTHTFSYPLVFSFQERRNKKTYIKLLEFLKQKFFEVNNFEIEIFGFKLDGKIGMIKSVEKFFSNPNIELCTIHIVRSFFKK
jgi:hypothetical protein